MIAVSELRAIAMTLPELEAGPPVQVAPSQAHPLVEKSWGHSAPKDVVAAHDERI